MITQEELVNNMVLFSKEVKFMGAYQILGIMVL